MVVVDLGSRKPEGEFQRRSGPVAPLSLALLLPRLLAPTNQGGPIGVVIYEMLRAGAWLMDGRHEARANRQAYDEGA